MSEEKKPQTTTEVNFAALISLQEAPSNLFRVTDDPAFVLRRSAWSETSVILDLFTKSRGRVAVAARGANRPASRFRGLLNPFYPLIVSARGIGNIKNLTKAQWMGGLQPLSGEGLISGFYLNELILRLTAPEDPHPDLFEAYLAALAKIALLQGLEAQRVLRGFEVTLLRECGWGQELLPGEKVQPCVMRQGEFVPCSELAARVPNEPVYSPKVVQAVLSGDFSDLSLLPAARQALRQALDFYAGEKVFLTRRTLLAWQRF